MRFSKLILGAIGFMAVAPAFSQTLVNGTYTQDFNTLAASGDNAWVQDSTLAEWWAYRFPPNPATWFDVSTYRANAGGTANGFLYSFGSTGSSDRALGSIATGTDSAGTMRFGTGFTNGFDAAITSTTISFSAESWRIGTAANINTFDFQYSVTASGVNDNTGTWLDFDSLDFTQEPGLGNGVWDGNAHFLLKSATISSLHIAQGSTLWIRWTDQLESGANHGLGIDDLVVNFETASAPVPEPGTMALMGLGALAFWHKRRNRITHLVSR